MNQKTKGTVIFGLGCIFAVISTKGCKEDTKAETDGGSGGDPHKSSDPKDTNSEPEDTNRDRPSGSDSQNTDPCRGPFAASPSVSDAFEPDWEDTQTLWRRASWTQNGTSMSPDRCVTNDDGYLEQTVLAGSPFQGGSMQSRDEYRYGRWVARLKPSSVPGALNSMFTMDWDDLTTDDTDGDGSHEEVDIEFLTYTFGENTGQVHLAVHRPGHSNYVAEDLELDFNPSDAFHEWGFDILPDRVNWHVDGEILHTFMYDENVTLTGYYELFFNSWTQENWINGPPSSDAVYQIDWVRFYPYDERCED